MTSFWLYDPKILFDKEHIDEFWPENEHKFARKLNALTRLIFVLTLGVFTLSNNLNHLFIGLISILAIVFIFFVNKNKKQEGFSQIKEKLSRNSEDVVQYEQVNDKNPLSNVLVTDILDKPNRKPAPPSYTKINTDIINNSTKNTIEKLNPDIDNLKSKLFNDLGDQYQFDTSMRSFYSTANTIIPNDQKGFADFCYGNLPSRKHTTVY